MGFIMRVVREVLSGGHIQDKTLRSQIRSHRALHMVLGNFLSHGHGNDILRLAF